MLLIPLLYWLSGENRPISIMLYGIALSTVVLLLYLGYRYVQHRRLYAALSEPMDMLQKHLVSLGDTPLSEAIHELLQLIDRQYQEQVNAHARQMDQHIVFMNRWVHQMKTPLSVIQLTLKDLEEEAPQVFRRNWNVCAEGWRWSSTLQDLTDLKMIFKLSRYFCAKPLVRR
ncbi:hypothetical protein MKX34_05225 [Paenibacillus sp. FSL R5-0636]|uniref:hypothetical protein n=1 Tax=Paenibacillus sp. FSL R5-0636 TaxID=2921652 RepID=UPI0030CDFA80